MSGATYAHMKAMHRVMKYCVDTPKRGLYLRPNRQWDRSNKHKFSIIGHSNSNYAKEPEKRRSVSGYSVFLEGAPVVMVSRMQGHVTLSVTESELGAAVNCAQDMMFVKRLLKSMDLKVELPMVLEVDNKGAMDLCNNWSTGGRTRHVDVRMYFLREMKEAGIINIQWIAGENNSTDMFTKNLATKLFCKHVISYCGQDEYLLLDNKGL